MLGRTQAAGLSLPGADAHRLLGHAGAAEVFEQENHFVLLVVKGIPATRYSVCCRPVPVALKLLDRFRQFGAAATAPPAALQNASAQELGNVLQFVSGQTLQEAPDRTLLRILQTCNQRAH